jgi:hypothetical protein
MVRSGKAKVERCGIRRLIESYYLYIHTGSHESYNLLNRGTVSRWAVTDIQPFACTVCIIAAPFFVECADS